jgi:hypothetical protein
MEMKMMKILAQTKRKIIAINILRSPEAIWQRRQLVYVGTIPSGVRNQCKKSRHCMDRVHYREVRSRARPLCADVASCRSVSLEFLLTNNFSILNSDKRRLSSA